MRALWACAFYAGLRRGELRALRWRDVDLREGVIRVARSWDDEEGEQADGKTDAATRSVPIVGALMPELRGHQIGRAAAAATSSSAPRPEGVRAVDGPAAGAARVGGGEARADHAARGAPHDGEPHDRRGRRREAICEWLGHATIAITYDR
jgi:integrase